MYRDRQVGLAFVPGRPLVELLILGSSGVRAHPSCRVPKYVPDSTELDGTGLISLDATGTNRPQMASQRQFSVRKPGFESP